MNAKLVAAALFLPCAALAQGFAGLGEVAAGFAQPQQGASLEFPADHGAHPDYRIEWWYLTANLQDAAGTDYGLQWTLFRTALAPESGAGWSAPQLWMGHAAVTTPDAHFVAERVARGGIGQAGVVGAPFSAWIDEWEMNGDFAQIGAPVALRAGGSDFAYDIRMQATGPLIRHGDDGYSVKSGAGQASHYYSQPYLALTGTLDLPGGDIAVTGQGWLDREWSSQPLAADQTGWDWFSLSFDDGAKLMGFQLRGDTDYSAATWIAPGGLVTAFPNGAFVAEPLAQTRVAGRDVPTNWQVRLADRGVDVQVSAINTAAWMQTSVPYWEGPVSISGSHSGKGYLEMTGYE